MKQVRVRVFETNSSSTHSLTIASKKQFDSWKEGKTVLYSDGKFYEGNEAKSLKWEDEIQTYSQFFDSENLETYIKEYTSESGDKIVAFGKYGYNG